MDDIIRGYWTCPYCDSANIDGLVDICPNCGRHKPMNIEYYMRLGEDGKARKEDRLSKEELDQAGISEEECDGEHKEWVCGYCDSLNNWADAFCWSCNSSRDEATKQYGMEDIPETDPVSPIIPGIIATAAECLKDELDQKILDSLNGSGDGPKRSYGMVSKSIMVDEGDLLGRNEQKKVCTRPSLWSRVKTIFGNRKKEILGSIVATAAVCLGAVLFWPIKEAQTATGFSWDRKIVIEEQRTVKEDGWSVPFGGRVYDEKSEFHHYEQVLDHYEAITEQKSRQVIDHYETKTVQKSRTVIVDYDVSYTDNGNGTFTEHKTPVYGTEYYTDTEEQPVYKTEYYEESHQEPVYRQEPVYQTKYYYEIDKWFTDYTSDSSGYDKSPYWNMNYTLEENERDSLRYENYYIYYIDEGGDQNKVSSSYDEWVEVDYGDQVIITTSRIGIDYKVESVEKGE